MNETPLLDKTASSKTQPRFFFKEYNVLFDTFRSRTAFVVSRSHALNQEIYRIEPQSRTVDQLRSWIALMHEIIKERDILKEEIVLQREKIEKRFKGLDVESGWRREHEEALSQRIEGLKEMLHFYEKEELQRLQQEAEIKTRINEGSDVVVSTPSNLIAPKRFYPDSPPPRLLSKPQPTKEITHSPSPFRPNPAGKEKSLTILPSLSFSLHQSL